MSESSLDHALVAARPGGPLRSLRAAFALLSRLPVGGFPYAAAEWRWAPAYFPWVGLVIGGLAAAVFSAARALGLGVLLGAGLTLLASILASGALHEDGLADSCDGLGGAHGGRRALEIMKDSRIGSYGALALLCSVLLRAGILCDLPAAAWFAIIHAHCLARVGPVWLLWRLRAVSVSDAPSSAALFDTRWPQFLAALACACACSGLGVAMGWLSLAGAASALIALATITALCGRYFRRAVGGITGDLLGFTEQIAEIAVLACALVPG